MKDDFPDPVGPIRRMITSCGAIACRLESVRRSVGNVFGLLLPRFKKLRAKSWLDQCGEGIQEALFLGGTIAKFL
jgi:hypothetical protein